MRRIGTGANRLTIGNKKLREKLYNVGLFFTVLAFGFFRYNSGIYQKLLDEAGHHPASSLKQVVSFLSVSQVCVIVFLSENNYWQSGFHFLILRFVRFIRS